MMVWLKGSYKHKTEEATPLRSLSHKEFLRVIDSSYTISGIIQCLIERAYLAFLGLFWRNEGKIKMTGFPLFIMTAVTVRGGGLSFFAGAQQSFGGDLYIKV
jgi:hypothetical protein